jgi:hypothetical protein
MKNSGIGRGSVWFVTFLVENRLCHNLIHGPDRLSAKITRGEIPSGLFFAFFPANLP